MRWEYFDPLLHSLNRLTQVVTFDTPEDTSEDDNELLQTLAPDDSDSDISHDHVLEYLSLWSILFLTYFSAVECSRHNRPITRLIITQFHLCWSKFTGSGYFKQSITDIADLLVGYSESMANDVVSNAYLSDTGTIPNYLPCDQIVEHFIRDAKDEAFLGGNRATLKSIQRHAINVDASLAARSIFDLEGGKHRLYSARGVNQDNVSRLMLGMKDIVTWTPGVFRRFPEEWKSKKPMHPDMFNFINERTRMDIVKILKGYSDDEDVFDD